MATEMQRKNRIAGDLAKKGVPKNVIIGILCNAYAESGIDGLSPFTGESDGTGLNGFGIWQFTSFGGANSFRSYIVSAVQGKDDLTAVDIETDALVTKTTTFGQWMTAYLPSNLKMSWNSFLKSNVSWQDATKMFCLGWERPGNMYGQAVSRQQYYNRVMNGLDLSGAGSGTSPNANKPKPNTSKQDDNIVDQILKDKVWTHTELEYCLSLFQDMLAPLYDKWLH